MPTIPTVFRTVRQNDIQQKPFKAYKSYSVSGLTYSGSAYRLQKAYHVGLLPTIGDGTTTYVTNNSFNTINNMHVVWNSLDHKYYRYPYDPAKSLELTNINKVEKNLFLSGSTLAVPFNKFGEKIKPGSVTLSSNVQNVPNTAGDFTISLYDDTYGNLRDTQIISSSFARKRNLQFYLSFNNEFRKFPLNTGNLISSSIDYVINNSNEVAQLLNVNIEEGVDVHTSGSNYFKSGLSGQFVTSSASYIKIEDNKIFNNFNRCDHWAISFWINPTDNEITGSILSKGRVRKRNIFNEQKNYTEFKDVRVSMPTPGIESFATHKTPFQISLYKEHIHFQSSDGSNEIHISASADYRNGWMNVIVHNSESLCRISINGTNIGTSGSIPVGVTNNDAYVLVGAHGNAAEESFQGNIAEMRMYDYALTNTNILSLANQNFYSGSLYQTSVPGNVFYKNGQIVISSPLPKYNNIFISSSNTDAGDWTLNYKGTHTIYENEVMIRVPKNTCNASMNPSATYRPATGDDNNCNEDGGAAEKYNGPGEFRKRMFVSGTAVPYVTTVGLYNDQAQLLAIGKMAEPIQKRNDVDMNFVLRWDY
jgi:hypothetical protein